MVYLVYTAPESREPEAIFMKKLGSMNDLPSLLNAAPENHHAKFPGAGNRHLWFSTHTSDRYGRRQLREGDGARSDELPNGLIEN